MKTRTTRLDLAIFYLSLLLFVSQTTFLQAVRAESKTAPVKSGSKTIPPAKAGTPTKPLTAPANTGKLKAGTPEFLWKAVSDSGATLYLLGTIHEVKADFYPLPQEMEEALTKSRALMVEIDPSKSDPIKIRDMTMSQGLLGQTDSLANHISSETMTALINSGVAPNLMQSFMRMRPWLVGLMLVQSEMAKLGYDPKLAIDAHFITNARNQGKKVIALETEEFQFSVLAGFPEELQDKLLLKTLLDIKQLKTEAGDLMKSWKDGSEKNMDILITELW